MRGRTDFGHKKKNYLAVVRTVTTSQKAWVEDHVNSFREKPLRYIVDGRGITRVYFVYNLTGVNQSISFMSITLRAIDESLRFTIHKCLPRLGQPLRHMICQDKLVPKEREKN